jgi:hypothetical protein
MCMGDARIDFADANARTCRCQSPRCVAKGSPLQLSSITLSTYLPSGDIAARAALAYSRLA